MKREYEVCSDKLLKNGCFVLLSDMHNKCYGKNNEKLLAAIKEMNPDAILIAGDMITASKGAKTTVPEQLIQELQGKYPIYYGNGNHEYRARIYPEDYKNLYGKYEANLQKLGLKPLINQKVYLPDYNMEIYGLEIDRKYYKKFTHLEMTVPYLEGLLGKSSSDRMQVLIAHNPEYLEGYSAWGADLVVSGHVHGGIMRLPVLGGVISPRLQLFPKYDGGEFICGKTKMILSRGLGTHTLPVRIFNPGELVVIHMKTI